MNSMLTTIAPKSDQLNADDLIGGQSKTIKITSVGILAGDQPVSLGYEGDSGKPYKPCKSMRRVLVQVWGSDGNAYIGRSMTLYRDDKVRFGGAEVGGIRISHMSDISEPITMALTATRTQRKPYTVNPLIVDDSPKSLREEQSKSNAIDNPIDTAIAMAKLATTSEELEQLAKDAPKLAGWTKHKTAEMGEVLKTKRQQFKLERQPGE